MTLYEVAYLRHAGADTMPPTPHNKLCGVNKIPCLQHVSRHSGKHTHKNFANKAEASEKSCIFAAESCRSGRTGQTRNLLNPSGFRGFESLTFRS